MGTIPRLIGIQTRRVRGKKRRLPQQKDGGPINWQVSEVTGGLNLRAAPSTSAKILATLSRRDTVRQFWLPAGSSTGCGAMFSSSAGERSAYVAAKYLTGAVSPNGTVIQGPDDSALRAGQGDFDATGQIPCSLLKGQPMTNVRIRRCPEGRRVCNGSDHQTRREQALHFSSVWAGPWAPTPARRTVIRSSRQ